MAQYIFVVRNLLFKCLQPDSQLLVLESLALKILTRGRNLLLALRQSALHLPNLLLNRRMPVAALGQRLLSLRALGQQYLQPVTHCDPRVFSRRKLLAQLLVPLLHPTALRLEP